MFKSLKKSQQSAPARKSSGYQSEYLLKGANKIHPLLRQIHSSHTLLNVSLDDSKNRYSTALLGVYADHGFLALDELTPAIGNKHLLSAKEIRVSCRLDGVDVYFKTRLLEAREQKGIALYKVAIPGAVRYMQRRLDHRVPTKSTNIPFSGRLTGDNPHLVKGKLFDISRNGVGIQLNGSSSLKQEDVLANCAIDLPQEGRIIFTLEIRYTRVDNAEKCMIAGGRFLEIETEAKQKINKVITHLEREEAKRLSRL